MDISASKKCKAVVIAVALMISAFSGCDNYSNNSEIEKTDSVTTNDTASSASDGEDPAMDIAGILGEDGKDDFTITDENGEIVDIEDEIMTEGDFSYYNMNTYAELYAYNGSETTVTIPETIGGLPVENVDLYIFSDNEKIEKVIIPSTTKSIGTFVYNTSLKAVDVNEKNPWFTSVDGVVFSNDKTKLVYYPGGRNGDYTLPDSVLEVGDAAFVECPNLKTLTLNSKLSSINASSLNNCSALTQFKLSGSSENLSVKDGVLFNKDETVLLIYPLGRSGDYSLPDTVTVIEESAFSSVSDIEKLVLPENLKEIKDNAFLGCEGLREIKFNDKLEGIGAYAFSSCIRLNKFALPKSLKTIGDNAFSFCSEITELNIPENVSEMFSSSFVYCDKLKKVTVNEKNKNFTEKDNVLYDKNITEILIYPAAREENYDIPDGVKSLPIGVFYECNNLTKVKVPKSVEFIDENSFYNCAALEAIEVDKDNPQYSSADGVLYDKEKRHVLAIPLSLSGELSIPASVEKINSDLFYENMAINAFSVDSGNKYYSSEKGVLFNKDKTKLIRFPNMKDGEYAIPNTVNSIEPYAFYGCTSVKSVTIPEGVANIACNTFENSGAEKIYISKSVKNIEMYAFNECFNLTNVYYAGSEEEWKQIKIEEGNDILSSDCLNYNS